MLGKFCSSWVHPLGMCWMQWCIHKHTILVFGAYSSWDWAAVQSQQQISCKKFCLLVILSILQVLELDFRVPLGFCDMPVLSLTTWHTWYLFWNKAYDCWFWHIFSAFIELFQHVIINLCLKQVSVLTFFTLVTLYANIIPISLYVSIEVKAFWTPCHLVHTLNSLWISTRMLDTM